jgi:hypothetical protein
MLIRSFQTKIASNQNGELVQLIREMYASMSLFQIMGYTAWTEDAISWQPETLPEAKA